jgi:division protein CdvB (Snf7/Vps24/ESCRT-III family)
MTETQRLKVELQSFRQRLEAAENADTNRQGDNVYETLKLELQDLRKGVTMQSLILHESEKKLEAATLENCALKKNGGDHGIESSRK